MKKFLKVLNQLQRAPLTDKELVQILPYARFEPRIAEELSRVIARDWKKWNFLRLHKHLAKHSDRAAFGALAEFGEILVEGELKPYRAWRKAVVPWSRPTNFQLFYLGVFPFAGKSAIEEASNSLTVFKKWGYLAQDAPINKLALRPSKRTLLKADARSRILENLTRNKNEIRVEDYLRQLGGQVSRRVAEMDLKRCHDLIASGQTRARVYRKRS